MFSDCYATSAKWSNARASMIVNIIKSDKDPLQICIEYGQPHHVTVLRFVSRMRVDREDAMCFEFHAERERVKGYILCSEKPVSALGG